MHEVYGYKQVQYEYCIQMFYSLQFLYEYFIVILLVDLWSKDWWSQIKLSLRSCFLLSLSICKRALTHTHKHTYARMHYAHTRIPVFNAPSLHDVTEVTDMIQREFFNELFLHHKGTCTTHENRRPFGFNYWHRERL